MDTQTLLKRVRRMAIWAQRRTQDLSSGEHRSAFRGSGISFSEVRPYVPGDDVRSIDWNVTARSGEPYVKLYEEERERSILLIVDLSRSSFFGTRHQIRRDQLLELCAILAFSAIKSQDQVGLLLFSNGVDAFLPPRKGRAQAMIVLRRLLEATPNGGTTNLAEALLFARNVLKKTSTCFILSDFIAPDFERPLRNLASKHQVVGISAWDPIEKRMPDVGLLPVRDPESGQRALLDTSDPEFRLQYAHMFAQNQRLCARQFKKAGATWVQMGVTDDYIIALLRLFKRRGHLQPR
jgi:uncharacterized protein (DUF58 family)